MLETNVQVIFILPNLFYKIFNKLFYLIFKYLFLHLDMDIFTENKRKRLERNKRIKDRYNKEMSEEGAMSSAVIAGICKSYRMTAPTVYSIIK